MSKSQKERIDTERQVIAETKALLKVRSHVTAGKKPDWAGGASPNAPGIVSKGPQIIALYGIDPVALYGLPAVPRSRI